MEITLVLLLTFDTSDEMTPIGMRSTEQWRRRRGHCALNVYISITTIALIMLNEYLRLRPNLISFSVKFYYVALPLKCMYFILWLSCRARFWRGPGRKTLIYVSNWMKVSSTESGRHRFHFWRSVIHRNSHSKRARPTQHTQPPFTI